LRLRASAARTARPCGESLLELAFQTLGRDVTFRLNLHRDLDPDPRGLEADDLHVVGHVLPVRMVIALAFFKRIFARSLPMNQAHGLIIAEVYGTRCVNTNSTFAQRRVRRRVMRRRAEVWRRSGNSRMGRGSVRWNDRSSVEHEVRVGRSSAEKP
jgi:hypothetical protein